MDGSHPLDHERLIADPNGDVGALAVAARTLESEGRSLLAMRAWQRVLGARPGDREALLALASLYDERGDVSRADACRAGVRGSAGAPQLQIGSPSPESPDLPPDPSSEGPSDADLVRFLHLFAGREDVHARMWREGDEVGWGPVHQPLSPELLRAHVGGGMTLGVYCVRLDQSATFLALDLDVTKAARERVRGDATGAATLRAGLQREGIRMVETLRGWGLDPLLEDSGYKGRHVWLFLTGAHPAERVSAAARALAAVFRPADPDFAVEAFPKQGRVRDGGLGNLIKLPLGLHLRSGRRAALLDAEGRPVGDPFAQLRAVRRIELSALEARLADVPVPPEPPEARSEPARPPAPPAPGPRPWTEADFEADPEVGAVVRGCPVIRDLVRSALADRRITREGAVVLNHSLGHLPNGPRAVNYLYDRVPAFAAEQRMGAPHRGSPVSCARIRQRVPDTADRVGCDCRLDVPPGAYAHPLLHRADAPPPPDPGLDERLDAYGRLLARLRQVEAEAAALRREIAARLEQVPDHRWRREGGEWVLADEGGLPVLRWEPR